MNYLLTNQRHSTPLVPHGVEFRRSLYFKVRLILDLYLYAYVLLIVPEDPGGRSPLNGGKGLPPGTSETITKTAERHSKH